MALSKPSAWNNGPSHARLVLKLNGFNRKLITKIQNYIQDEISVFGGNMKKDNISEILLLTVPSVKNRGSEFVIKTSPDNGFFITLDAFRISPSGLITLRVTPSETFLRMVNVYLFPGDKDTIVDFMTIGSVNTPVPAKIYEKLTDKMRVNNYLSFKMEDLRLLEFGQIKTIFGRQSHVSWVPERVATVANTLPVSNAAPDNKEKHESTLDQAKLVVSLEDTAIDTSKQQAPTLPSLTPKQSTSTAEEPNISAIEAPASSEAKVGTSTPKTDGATALNVSTKIETIVTTNEEENDIIADIRHQLQSCDPSNVEKIAALANQLCSEIVQARASQETAPSYEDVHSPPHHSDGWDDDQSWS